MGIFVGLDLGSVSAKLAAIWDFDATVAQSLPRELPAFFRASSKGEENAGGPRLLSAYRRTLGNPGQTEAAGA
jgi:hypothetical protein